jgi:2-polyprenyl-6-methoxyphenol hydroxylase-like FAD-dependent oxidoreductase
VQHLGYYYALADISGEASQEDAMYNEPGRMVMTTGAGGPSVFVFASEPLKYGRDNAERQKQLLIDAFRGSAWKLPALMEGVPSAGEFYMDSVSRVIIDRYSSGRVVLVGDSAYGNTLGGFGTGLAVVGAYVLAGELYRSGGDYRIAYAQYEAKFRNYAKVSRTVNAGELLAPTTRFGLFVRNRMFSIAPLFMGVMKLIDYFATDIELDDYARIP